MTGFAIDDDEEDDDPRHAGGREDIAAFYGHYDPRGPIAAFLLLLLFVGVLTALIFEAVRPGGH